MKSDQDITTQQQIRRRVTKQKRVFQVYIDHEDPDQSAYLCSLIRTFAVYLHIVT